MFAKVFSACLTGIHARLIQVEIDISPGLPQFHIVGLPDLAVKESMKRVRAAIKNSGFQFPMQRITVNLAPADLRKEGAAFDLAIAAGVLLASGQIHPSTLLPEKSLIVGELSLDGHIRKIPGILPIAEQAVLIGEMNLILPHDNVQEAAMQPRIKLFPLHHLKDLQKHLTRLNIHDIKNMQTPDKNVNISDEIEDFSDVERQYQAKRAALIAAAGFHHLLLIGPPGSGKTMILRRIHGLLPPLNEEEQLEVSKIYSITRGIRRLSEHGFGPRPPVRSPHHTISQTALIGGGGTPRPGEITLAHNGLLILDELAEFSIRTLETLRQPLEEGMISINRTRSSVVFPARFLFAAAMNPCRCGYASTNATEGNCQCSDKQIRLYQGKISGPLSDRIDLQIEMAPFIQSEEKHPDTLASFHWDTSSMRDKVLEARERQHHRYLMLEEPAHLFNGQMNHALIKKSILLSPEDEVLLTTAMKHHGLSARARDRILKLARTIADLEGAEHVTTPHLAEALQYRCLDKSKRRSQSKPE